jgi:CubicO group peptidase (beta-lactamase class C family)
VRRYIPELPDYGTPVTIQHLLHHTSGLRENHYLSELAGWRWDDVLTNSDSLDIVVRQKQLNFTPGTEHSYDNSGYLLLGIIVQRVSGRTLRAFTALAPSSLQLDPSPVDSPQTIGRFLVPVRG